MIIHLFVGSLIFLFFGRLYGWEMTGWDLILGAFFGAFTDLVSFIVGPNAKINKESHKHRDNFTHSLVFSLFVFLANLPLWGWQWSVMIGLAVLSHPLLDTFGIGWGVKLFYPWSMKTYKLFYGGKILKVFNTPEEADREAEKYGMDDWVKRVYFTFNPNFMAEKIFGIMEWISLIALMVLLYKTPW